MALNCNRTSKLVFVFDGRQGNRIPQLLISAYLVIVRLLHIAWWRCCQTECNQSGDESWDLKHAFIKHTITCKSQRNYYCHKFTIPGSFSVQSYGVTTGSLLFCFVYHS